MDIAQEWVVTSRQDMCIICIFRSSVMVTPEDPRSMNSHIIIPIIHQHRTQSKGHKTRKTNPPNLDERENKTTKPVPDSPNRSPPPHHKNFTRGNDKIASPVQASSRNPPPRMWSMTEIKKLSLYRSRAPSLAKEAQTRPRWIYRPARHNFHPTKQRAPFVHPSERRYNRDGRHRLPLSRVRTKMMRT